MEILNQGNGSNFCNNRRLEVLHITLEPFGLMESIIGREVSSEPSFSGRTHAIQLWRLFTRNYQRTSWDSFREDLKGRLEQGS